MDKKIILGADPCGFTLKESVKEYLISNGYDVTDVGTLSLDNPVAYYDAGYNVGKEIADKKFNRGFLFCGTGMGVSIVANKFPGVYCGLCESVQTARLCRTINNCNILSVGGLLTAPYKAIEMIEAFLSTEFSTGFSEANPEYLTCAYDEIYKLEKQIISEYR